MENDFIRVCKLSELNKNSGRKFIVNEMEIAVFKVDEKVFALSNICPHQHSSIIHDGFLEAGHIVCPAHGWKFHLENGKQPGGRRGLDSYQVKIENGEVFVKVFKKSLNW